MAMGQLISEDDVEDLLVQAPTISSFEGDESKLYTLLLFGKLFLHELYVIWKNQLQDIQEMLRPSSRNLIREYCIG